MIFYIHTAKLQIKFGYNKYYQYDYFKISKNLYGTMFIGTNI
jgi:hypothetical protein